MKLDFAVDYMKILETDEDTALVELYLLHTGKNRNQYIINREAVEKALPTFYNKPIIYRLNNEFIPSMATDVLEHGTVEDRGMRIAGVIPESAPMEFVEMNGKEYLRTKGVIYKIYQPSLMNILTNRGGNVKVSIEIYVTDKFEEEDGSWNITEFKFEGVALLGADILEGIEGSQLNVLKFSAKDFNEHYMGFATKEIPSVVKNNVNKALEKRKLCGKGGSSAAVNMAKYLIGNEYIDNIRLNTIKDYFDKHNNSENLSFALFGGEEAKKWVNEILEGKRVNYAMKNISEEWVRDRIHDYLRELAGDDMWRYWINILYIEPKQVIIVDDKENKSYLVPFEILKDINDEDMVLVKWEEKKEVVRCYIPVDKVNDDTLEFANKKPSYEDLKCQLITYTHRLMSSEDPSDAKKAEALLNSLEKEDERMKEEEEEKKVENSCGEEEKNCDNSVKNCDVKNCDETKMNAEDEAKKVEDEEKKEDRKEDDKEEEDEKEDFAALVNDLRKENAELKASLETYKKKEEKEQMNALIKEFSYCFEEDEAKKLVESLDKMTFAEVNDIVNLKVREFAKNNMPKADKEEKSSFKVGLPVSSFSIKDNEEKASTIKEILHKYGK